VRSEATERPLASVPKAKKALRAVIPAGRMAARRGVDTVGIFARTGRPTLPGPVWTRAGGQMVARIFPQDLRAYQKGASLHR
jgi:hypothetical protein